MPGLQTPISPRSNSAYDLLSSREALQHRVDRPGDPNENGADPDEQNRRRRKWSGWVYAYRTFWVDPGADWDEEKTAEFLELAPTAGA
jgi:hypothetical protein